MSVGPLTRGTHERKQLSATAAFVYVKYESCREWRLLRPDCKANEHESKNPRGERKAFLTESKVLTGFTSALKQ